MQIDNRDCSNIVMSVEEQNEIINWANNNFTKFRPNGHGRQYCIFDNINDENIEYSKNNLPLIDANYPLSIMSIKKRIVCLENLHGSIQEPKFKDFISYITDQGQIHQHVDHNSNNLIHTRFNVIVQLPNIGGLPIYNDNIILINEREYVRCDSGLHKHYCQKVHGDKARIVISYGFLI
jgi:hypothetical protein